MFEAREFLKNLLNAGVSLYEPADYLLTSADIVENGLEWYHAASLIPLVSAKLVKVLVRPFTKISSSIARSDLAFEAAGSGPKMVVSPGTRVVMQEGKIVSLETLKFTEQQIKALRAEGVDQAWKLERELVQLTGQGTRPWSKAELDELIKTGRVNGYEGHHIKSVDAHPEYAANPNNIEFLGPGRAPHLDAHGGNFKNPTDGDFIDRLERVERARTFKKLD
jgi:hypothetical protein